jgi:hypothetical protein
MTAEEKKIYNNGFILGMASKGVIKVTEKAPSEGDIKATEMWYLLNQDVVEASL